MLTNIPGSRYGNKKRKILYWKKYFLHF
jgi:hypothetical protein